MFVLAVENYEYPMIGCCGASRTDIIYPVGTTVDFSKFKKRCIDIISAYPDVDCYSLEYFQGEEGQSSRGDSESYLKFIRLTNGEWMMYEGSELKFSVFSIDDLLSVWGA